MSHVFALVAIAALFGLTFIVYIALGALLSIFIEKFRLGTRGVRTRGACVGYTSGRYGNAVVVSFVDAAGTANQMTTDTWTGVLPERGSDVEIVYLPQAPKTATAWPVRSLVPNAIYMAIAVPVLLALGVACVLAAAWVSHIAWFPG